MLRRVLIALALVGVYVSARALQIHYSTAVQPCSINDVWDCGVVNHSPYAVLYGVPVAAIGIAGYVLLGAFAALQKYRVVAAGALAGLGFSLYLAHIEASVLGAWCIYCVASLATISLITLLSFLQLGLRTRAGSRASEAAAGK
jgi:uncharacterized membrane protein